MESDGFIYAQDKNGSTLENAVIFLEDEDLSSIVLADKLSIKSSNTTVQLDFKDGSIYHNIFDSSPHIISEFGELKIPLKKSRNQLSGLSLTKLFDYSSHSSKSAMQWNVSIPLTIFTLLILGVHFAKVEPRQGRLSVLLPAVFIYILYLSCLLYTSDAADE